MKTSPVEGMKDYLPEENALREELIQKIVKTYAENGFRRVTTPIVERLENLDNSDGGENLKLIYRIEKRGEKLSNAIAAGNPKEFCDLGLRYDLTLPLARYYTAHAAELPTPFKCIQVDRVYRAERPQKGRMREFIQCDIDILGSESTDCESELMSVTAEALQKIGIRSFRILVNHRAVIRSVILHCGFTEEQVSSVCVTIDKLDKIGLEGVRAELFSKSFAAEAAEKLCAVLSDPPRTAEQLREYGAAEAADELFSVMETAREIAAGAYEIVFDLTLVRGQGYYTGIVFEAVCDEFGGTVAGGGRYDGLIGRFSGKDVPAVGFSIGFERIYSVLTERGAAAAGRKRAAVLYSEGNFSEAYRYAKTLHGEYDTAALQMKKKLGKQLSQLEQQGYACAVLCKENGEKEIRMLGESGSNAQGL